MTVLVLTSRLLRLPFLFRPHTLQVPRDLSSEPQIHPSNRLPERPLGCEQPLRSSTVKLHLCAHCPPDRCLPLVAVGCPVPASIQPFQPDDKASSSPDACLTHVPTGGHRLSVPPPKYLPPCSLLWLRSFGSCLDQCQILSLGPLSAPPPSEYKMQIGSSPSLHNIL